MPDPFVVMGGDAAGLSAASKFKRETTDREVIIFEQGAGGPSRTAGCPTRSRVT
jgi:protoporphyrinogen oxidase